MRREERTFAWQVGGVLAILGAWRTVAHATLPLGVETLRRPAALVMAAGIALIAAGLWAPQRLVGLRRAWLALGDRLQRITGPVVAALLYFVLVTPIGWLRRTLGRSPLARDRGASSYWVTPHDGDATAPTRHDKPY